ncbi:MAG: DNA-binding protein [Deltaproteobacteria bacterium]|nr:DNA-binding protein [Deltaproteobacteria bacterium]
MAQLTIRNVDDDVVKALRLRAAQHGRSAEAEVREILKEALLTYGSRTSFLDFLASMPEGLSDEDLERSSERPRDVDL